MKCFYHGDADGKCAGYLVDLMAPLDGYSTEFIEADYAMKFPLDKINGGEIVYIVDFSISPEDMTHLLKRTKNVIWIDHHKTAIEKYKDFEGDIPGLRVDGIAGCMLTWLYLKCGVDQHSYRITALDAFIREAPLFVKLIADWDVWKFEYGEDTKLFHLGLGVYDLHPQSSNWFFMKDTQVDNIIHEGAIIKKHSDNSAKAYLEKFGFATEFLGLRCLAVNRQFVNSEFFKSAPEGYDAFMAFAYDGEIWRVSMYQARPDVDVSEICKQYGGGGHKGAAGFSSDYLPFAEL